MAHDLELELSVKASLENILKLTYTFPEYIKEVETDMFLIMKSDRRISFRFGIDPNLFSDILVLCVQLRSRIMQLRYGGTSRYFFRGYPEYNCVKNLLKLHIESAYVIFRIENYIKECVGNQNRI